MSDEILLSPTQIQKMKHSLGLNKIIGNRAPKAYRNYYNSGNLIDDDFEKLCNIDLAEKAVKSKEDGGIYYFITKEGIKVLKQYIGNFKII